MIAVLQGLDLKVHELTTFKALPFEKRQQLIELGAKPDAIALIVRAFKQKLANENIEKLYVKQEELRAHCLTIKPDDLYGWQENTNHSQP